MRIDHLQYLVEVHKTGSISKAAENLYISQQGLSQAIRTLEKHIGVSVLNHSGNKISFTAEGEIVVEKAKEILIKVAELFAAVNPQINELNPAKDQALTIFLTPFFSTTIFPKLLHQFRVKYPNIQLLILEKSPSQLINDMCRNHNAIGLVNIIEDDFEPKFFDDNNLTFKLLFECEYLVLVNKNSPLADRTFISVGEISKSNFAILDFEQMNSVYERLFKMINKPNIVLRTVNQDLYTATISSGLAIGLSPSISKTFGKDSLLTAVPIKPSLKAFIGCVSYTESQNPNIQLFLNNMANFFNNSYF